MGAWGVTMRESDYGLDLLASIEDRQLKAVDFSTFNVADALEVIKADIMEEAYVHIEDWRNRPLQGGRYPYVYVDGIYLRRNWGGEFENVAILVAIAVNED